MLTQAPHLFSSLLEGDQKALEALETILDRGR